MRDDKQEWKADFPMREEVEDYGGKVRVFVISCHEGGLGFTVRAEEEGTQGTGYEFAAYSETRRLGLSNDDRGRARVTPSAPGERLSTREISMSKAKARNHDLKAEYDLRNMQEGVRGKYVDRIREGSNLARLDPEVADAFPSDAAVNEALRRVLNTTRAVKGKGGLPNKTLQPTSRTGRKRKGRKSPPAARG